MKKLFLLIPNLIKSGFNLWEKSKEWDAKKRIIVFTVAPLALILFTIVVKFVGVDTANFAAQLLIDVINSFSEMM